MTSSSRTFPIAAILLALLLAAVPAADRRNDRLVLMRSAFGSGTAGANARIAFELVQTQTVSPVVPSTVRLALHPGYLAPPSDRSGLIARSRIAGVVIGEVAPDEPLALDFAGNRDGRIDVADLVAATNRQRP
jgi:hypothetical protein